MSLIRFNPHPNPVRVTDTLIDTNHNLTLIKEYDAYVKRKLGDEIAGVVAEFGDRTRVEVSGVLLLRSMCRLTHKGHQQYAKGDGQAFHDYLSRE